MVSALSLALPGLSPQVLGNITTQAHLNLKGHEAVPPCVLASFLAVALRPGRAGAGFVIVTWKSHGTGVGALVGDEQLSHCLTL